MPALVKHRRGAALLWTLAVLILTLAATLTVAQLAATAATRRQLDGADQLAAALLPGTEQAILHWLEREAPKVILPSDAEEPQVQVLDDLILIADRQWRLTITAFDQCGMVPLRAVFAGSPLRLAVDDELLAVIDSIELDELSDKVPLGLDMFEGLPPSSLLVYPAAQGIVPEGELNRADPLIFASFVRITTAGTVVVNERPPLPSVHWPLALGAVFGTHTAKTGPINVNTAPAWLLEAALRQAGRGGLEQILDNRAANRSSPVPQAATGIASSDESMMPTFVSASDLWSFRIDARCAIAGGAQGFVGGSWWAVYQRSSSSTTPWTCVQRLAITD